VSLFRRRPRLPAARRPPLEPEERVVAWAAVSDSDAVIVTNRGLWLPDEPLGGLDGGPDGPPPPVRLGWHMIHKAAWSGRELTVIPAEVVERRPAYALVADLPARTYLLLEPGDVPEQVRARVTGSVAYTRHHPAPGGGAGLAGPAGLASSLLGPGGAGLAGPAGLASSLLGPGGGVRVVGRRVSGVDGLTWTVRADPGTDADSPAALALLDELVAQARTQMPSAAG
jgi:hypothetical protein